MLVLSLLLHHAIAAEKPKNNVTIFLPKAVGEYNPEKDEWKLKEGATKDDLIKALTNQVKQMEVALAQREAAAKGKK